MSTLVEVKCAPRALLPVVPCTGWVSTLVQEKCAPRAICSRSVHTLHLCKCESRALVPVQHAFMARLELKLELVPGTVSTVSLELHEHGTGVSRVILEL